MRLIRTIAVQACLCLALAGCGSDTHSVHERGIIEYATLLGISDSCNVQIANPWKSDALLQEFTIDRAFEKVIVSTNSLAALFSELDIAEKIAGVSEPEYISDSTIQAMVRDGRIADCGSGMYPNVERIMDLAPDAIFISPFEGGNYSQLEKLGIPLIQCADYMETSPLGRAEWIRLYGRLMGVEAKADSLFLSIRDRYMELCSLAATTQKRPKVMLDTRSGSAWYTAGGGSTIGITLSDAGASYAFRDRKESGSIPLPFETVLEQAHDSDIWLLKNSTDHTMTYALLESDFGGYARFRPFIEKKIWVCDVYRTPYFEETAFHPERLLSDFIAIMHPSTGLKARYYHPLD